jgi:hypothetical protein
MPRLSQHLLWGEPCIGHLTPDSHPPCGPIATGWAAATSPVATVGVSTCRPPARSHIDESITHDHETGWPTWSGIVTAPPGRHQQALVEGSRWQSDAVAGKAVVVRWGGFPWHAGHRLFSPTNSQRYRESAQQSLSAGSRPADVSSARRTQTSRRTTFDACTTSHWESGRTARMGQAYGNSPSQHTDRLSRLLAAPWSGRMWCRGWVNRDFCWW